MRFAVPLVLFALLLAGCAAPLQPASVALPAPLDKPVARVVSVVNPAGGEGEPSLGVMPDGTLFTNGAGQSGALYVSKDGGVTWKGLGSPTAPFPNEDPDLAASADGVLWYDNLWIGCTTVAASKDQGKTWTTSPAGCVPPAGDRQYVIPVKGGEAYLFSHHVPTLQQMVVHTTDYGQTWLPVGAAEGVTPPLATGVSGWAGGGFYNAAKGSAFVTFTWADSALENGQRMPGFGVLRQGAQTFELRTIPNAGGDAVGLGLVVGAADKAGNVYLSWAEAKQDDMAVYLAVSKDDGKTFGKPVRVDTGANSKVFPAIAAAGQGRVAIAYYEANEAKYPAAVSKDAKWNVTLAWTKDALADAPQFEHANLSTRSLRTGPICTDGTTCAKGTRELLDYFALKRLPDGRVASVWTSTDDVPGKTVNVFGATDEALLAG